MGFRGMTPIMENQMDQKWKFKGTLRVCKAFQNLRTPKTDSNNYTIFLFQASRGTSYKLPLVKIIVYMGRLLDLHTRVGGLGFRVLG